MKRSEMVERLAKSIMNQGPSFREEFTDFIIVGARKMAHDVLFECERAGMMPPAVKTYVSASDKQEYYFVNKWELE